MIEMPDQFYDDVLSICGSFAYKAQFGDFPKKDLTSDAIDPKMVDIFTEFGRLTMHYQIALFHVMKGRLKAEEETFMTHQKAWTEQVRKIQEVISTDEINDFIRAEGNVMKAFGLPVIPLAVGYAEN